MAALENEGDQGVKPPNRSEAHSDWLSDSAPVDSAALGVVGSDKSGWEARGFAGRSEPSG